MRAGRGAGSRAALLAAALFAGAGLARVPAAAARTPAAGSQAGAAAARVASEIAPVRAALASQAWARAETLATAGLAAARTSADSADWIAPLILARWRNDHEKLPGTSALAERALATRLASPGPDPSPLAVAYEGSGYGLAGLGRSREAEPRVLAGLAIRTRHPSAPGAGILHHPPPP